MKSLEEHRKERYMDVDDFVKFIGVSLRTYYRLLKREPARLATMRRIAKQLKVAPGEITEFVQQRED